MSDPLVVCVVCYRHVRASERACPFCRAALDGPLLASRPGALHTAVIAAALALAASDRAHAQQSPLGSPRLGLLHGGAEGYGAPPAPTPMPVMEPPHAPTEAPRAEEQMTPALAPAVFEFARQPLRPRSRRSRVAETWSIALRIGADGSWAAPGRSGRLSPSQMTDLRAAIARTSLSPEPTTLQVPLTPTRVERVTLGARSVRWRDPGVGLPNRDLRHLIELAYRLTRTRS